MKTGISKIYIGMISLALIGFVAFSGCGLKADTAEGPEITESIDYAALYQEEPVNDVLKEDWVKEDVSEAKQFMALSEYKANVFPAKNTGDRFFLGFFADSEYIYSLEQYHTQGVDSTSIYLRKLNISDKTVTDVDYSESINTALLDPYVLEGEIFAAGADYNKENYNLEKFMVFKLLPDGSVEEKTDVADVIVAHGWYPENPEHLYAPSVKLFYEPLSGNTYVLPHNGDCLVVVDDSGNEVSAFTGFEADSRINIIDFANTDDGHIIFMAVEGEKETVFVYEGKEPKILYSGERGSEATSTMRVIDDHGNILFLNGFGSETIISWNIATGAQEKVFSNTSGSNRDYVDCFARNGKGEILLLVNNNLKVLSLGGVAQTIEITVDAPRTLGYQQRECMNRYEEAHPGIKFKIIPTGNGKSKEIYLNQMYSDIIDGKGPDLIFLDYLDLNSLVENNCLYEMTDVLKKDITDNLVPAVLESGCIDGKKYMMTLEPNLKTLFVNKKYCADDSWTITDIINIVEKREKEGNPFERLVVGPYYNGNPLWVIITNICESEFVDLKNNSCNFESEDFIRLLNLCKKDIDKGTKNKDDAATLMKEDRALIFQGLTLTFVEYSEDYASLGEDEFRTIGYPTTSGNGNGLTINGGFVVNRVNIEKDADKKRIIDDFLNCLYTYEYLLDTVTSTVPTRMDLYDDRIVCIEGTGHIKLDGHSYATVACKKDGTPFLDEYLNLLRSCSGVTYGTTADQMIKSIIDEETAPFFAGEKSAEEVARIIQSRVKLYLEENK